MRNIFLRSIYHSFESFMTLSFEGNNDRGNDAQTDNIPTGSDSQDTTFEWDHRSEAPGVLAESTAQRWDLRASLVNPSEWSSTPTLWNSQISEQSINWDTTDFNVDDMFESYEEFADLKKDIIKMSADFQNYTPEDFQRAQEILDRGLDELHDFAQVYNHDFIEDHKNSSQDNDPDRKYYKAIVLIGAKDERGLPAELAENLQNMTANEFTEQYNQNDRIFILNANGHRAEDLEVGSELTMYMYFNNDYNANFENLNLGDTLPDIVEGITIHDIWNTEFTRQGLIWDFYNVDGVMARATMWEKVIILRLRSPQKVQEMYDEIDKQIADLLADYPESRHEYMQGIVRPLLLRGEELPSKRFLAFLSHDIVRDFLWGEDAMQRRMAEIMEVYKNQSFDRETVANTFKWIFSDIQKEQIQEALWTDDMRILADIIVVYQMSESMTQATWVFSVRDVITRLTEKMGVSEDIFKTDEELLREYPYDIGEAIIYIDFHYSEDERKDLQRVLGLNTYDASEIALAVALWQIKNRDNPEFEDIAVDGRPWSLELEELGITREQNVSFNEQKAATYIWKQNVQEIRRLFRAKETDSLEFLALTVARWQQANGAYVDGMPGPNTLGSLRENYPESLFSSDLYAKYEDINGLKNPSIEYKESIWWEKDPSAYKSYNIIEAASYIDDLSSDNIEKLITLFDILGENIGSEAIAYWIAKAQIAYNSNHHIEDLEGALEVTGIPSEETLQALFGAETLDEVFENNSQWEAISQIEYRKEDYYNEHQARSYLKMLYTDDQIGLLQNAFFPSNTEDNDSSDLEQINNLTSVIADFQLRIGLIPDGKIWPETRPLVAQYYPIEESQLEPVDRTTIVGNTTSSQNNLLEGTWEPEINYEVAINYMEKYFTVKDLRKIRSMLWNGWMRNRWIVNAVAEYQRNNNIPVDGLLRTEYLLAGLPKPNTNPQEIVQIHPKDLDIQETTLWQEIAISINYHGTIHNANEFTCGINVWTELIANGFENMPRSRRHGYRWEEILRDRPDQFLDVTHLYTPSTAPPWSVISYDKNTWWSQQRQDYGHVEIALGDIGKGKRWYYFGPIENRPGWSNPNFEEGTYSIFLPISKKIPTTPLQIAQNILTPSDVGTLD